MKIKGAPVKSSLPEHIFSDVWVLSGGTLTKDQTQRLVRLIESETLRGVAATLSACDILDLAVHYQDLADEVLAGHRLLDE